jgi:putative peptidoglycan lipid II flippase
LSKRSGDLLSAAALVFLVTVFGRLLGFIRDLMIARYFGATADTDAFLIAWMVPETVSPLLFDGAMVWVFVPLFGRELEKKGTVSSLLSRTLSPVAAALAILSAAVALSAPWTVPLSSSSGLPGMCGRP